MEETRVRNHERSPRPDNLTKTRRRGVHRMKLVFKKLETNTISFFRDLASSALLKHLQRLLIVLGQRVHGIQFRSAAGISLSATRFLALLLSN